MKQKPTYRPPVVVVLGHVDHGKTTLLDTIRKTKKAEGEAGGITQDIGAYEVTVPVSGYHTNKITFIDTPGHEAFTKLRSRGAKVADVAVLVVDAVDSVMPQTVESLAHVRDAKIPFVVAINKIDLPGAGVEKVVRDLAKEGVRFDDAGGDTPALAISAKEGRGLDELLEAILLIASDRELTYDTKNPPEAYIIESQMTKAGPAVSVVIKDGTLGVGDVVFAYDARAKIKALINDRGESVTSVEPSTPCVLLGFSKLPEVGVSITKERKKSAKEEVKVEEKVLSPEDFFGQKKTKTLKLIIKADTQGSLDAVLSSLEENKLIAVILAGIGEISKSDIFLAKVSQAVVVGFRVGIDKAVSDLAEQERVVVKTYSIIYELVDELTEVSNLMEEKETKEKKLKGEAKILATFIIEKEKIAGIKVLKGKLNLDDTVELFRGDKRLSKAKLVSLKTRAKTIKELKKNEEGGAILNPELDFNVGDMIKSYSI